MHKLLAFFWYPLGDPAHFPFYYPKPVEQTTVDVITEVVHDVVHDVLPDEADEGTGIYRVRRSNNPLENERLAARARGRIGRLLAQRDKYKQKGMDTERLEMSIAAYQRQLAWSEPEISNDLDPA